MQTLHRRPKGADAGEDQALGLEDIRRAFDLGEFEPEGVNSVAQAADIAGAVVQKRDHAGIRWLKVDEATPRGRRMGTRRGTMG